MQKISCPFPFKRLTKTKSQSEQNENRIIKLMIPQVSTVFSCPPGAYLIVITKREKVGELLGHTIWRVADTEIHSYKRTTTHLTEQQVIFYIFYVLAKAQLHLHNVWDENEQCVCVCVCVCVRAFACMHMCCDAYVWFCAPMWIFLCSLQVLNAV